MGMISGKVRLKDSDPVGLTPRSTDAKGWQEPGLALGNASLYMTFII
jgi:hypothetical protein